MWTSCAPWTLTSRKGCWNHVRDGTWTAVGRLASREAAAPLVTKSTVFPKIMLLFALGGNVSFLLWQGCEPYYMGGKSNITAEAPALGSRCVMTTALAWLLVTHCAGGNKPSPDLTPHCSHCPLCAKTPWTHCARRDAQNSVGPDGRGWDLATRPRMTVSLEAALKIDYHCL